MIMLPPGIRRQLFLSVMIFTLAGIAKAVSPGEMQVEDVASQSPAPAIEAGSRLLEGDPAQNEFYILGENEADPIKKDKGPAFVNSKPLQAGIEANNILNAEPAKIIDASNVPNEQVDTDHSTPVNTQPSKTSVDSKLQKEEPRQADDNSNLTKVKNILHKLTRKMAVKKVNLKTKIASRLRASSLASNTRHVRIKHMAAKGHVNRKARHEPELAVLKIRYLG